MRKRFRRPVRTDDIGQVNRLFSYTVLFILSMSLLGIASLSKNYIAGVFISQLAILIPLAMYLILNIGRIKDVISLRKPNLISMAAAVIMGFSFIPFISLVNQLSMVFVKNTTINRATEAAEKYPVIVMLLLAAVIPSAVEELFFRGVFFTAYRRKGIIKGAILSAILFGLLHGNLNQLAYAIVAGFIFAMTDYAGGSVVYSMIIHMMINATTVVGLYNFKLKSSLEGIIYFSKNYKSVGEVLKYMFLPAVIGLIITVCMYSVIRKSSYKTVEQLEATENRLGVYKTYKNVKLIDASLMVGVIIMMVNIVANELIK